MVLPIYYDEGGLGNFSVIEIFIKPIYFFDFFFIQNMTKHMILLC